MFGYPRPRPRSDRAEPGPGLELLGRGKDHFEADRALAERFGQVVPKMPLIARLTRRFIANTVSMLNSSPEGKTAYLDADLRDPAKILAQAAETPDFSQPVAVLLVAVLYFVQDRDDPCHIVTTLMDAVPPGSYLAILHGAS